MLSRIAGFSSGSWPVIDLFEGKRAEVTLLTGNTEAELASVVVFIPTPIPQPPTLRLWDVKSPCGKVWVCKRSIQIERQNQKCQKRSCVFSVQRRGVVQCIHSLS